MYRPTIVTKLTGGLGNQLFCYASARGVANRLGAVLRFHRANYLAQGNRAYALGHFHTVVHDDSILDKVLIGISARPALRHVGSALRPMLGRWGFDVVQDDWTGYDPGRFPRDRSLYLRGYWQSERYFKHIENEIRSELRMIEPPREIDRPILEKINATESVCVHIRRGDLLSNPDYAAKFHVQDANYFHRAVDRIRESVTHPHFYVFSDDRDWPRNHLSLGDDVDFLCEAQSPARADWQDFQLMRACKHFIIANSTFSWWAAWLSTHESKRVIAPRQWERGFESPLNDLIPEEWTLL